MSKKKKTILIFVFVLLFACPIIAAAITYYSLIRENSFSPAEMEMRISENDSKPQETQSRTDYTFEQSDRGYSVSKKIAAVMDFKSTGGQLRIKLIPSWVKNEAGKEFVCANLDNCSDFRSWKKGDDGRLVMVCNSYGGSIVTLVLDEYWSRYWVFNEDEGCFYYIGTAEPDSEAANFIESVEISKDVYDATDGYTLKIDVLADSIQVSDSAADKRNWGK